MKTYSYLLLCMILLACSSKPQANDQSDTTKTSAEPPKTTVAFDLAKLKLDENLMQLMSNLSIKPEAADPLVSTLLGYETFQSSNSKLLNFETKDLSGQKNHVLFHYQKENGILAGYELYLYTQEQTDELIDLLPKMSTAVFKQTKVTAGGIELDENGNEIKQQSSERKTFRVWENKSNGLSYFLTETGSGKSLVAKLIAVKRSTQFGKDLISTLSLDWYKNSKSESL